MCEYWSKNFFLPLGSAQYSEPHPPRGGPFQIFFLPILLKNTFFLFLFTEKIFFNVFHLSLVYFIKFYQNNVENRKNVPEDYSYFSCYPNPFNDHLTIKFFTFEDKRINQRPRK